MKTLRVTLQFCLVLCLLSLTASAASASTLTLTGNLHFPALDGSAQDSDGLANGTFTVDGDLVLDGTIYCNDVQPLPQSAGACPIKISVSGDLTLEPGSGIFAENRRGEGNGGNVRLDVGGDLTLHGPDGSLPGAIISTSQLLGSGGFAGTLTAAVVGSVELQAGSTLAASSKSAKAGAITVTGDTVLVAGLVASGPTRTLLSTPLSGEVLADGGVGQAGGTILLRALGASEAGLRIEPGGIVVSQGEGNGGKLVLLEACGIEVRGLVASLSRNNGPSQVVLRSGKGILVDGRDLGSLLPAEGRFGRIRADGTQQGAAGYLVDLFAESDIQILGPEPSSGQGLFAVTSRPGDQPLRNAGGTITGITLSGGLTATGNAFETGRDVQGDKGGVVDLRARGNVMLDGATIWAVGGFTSNLSPNARAGGHIDIRSFQGAVSWAFGVGDVRPTGTGVPVARRGTIEITACTTVEITGTQFPVTGSAVAPFPVETEGVCSPTAPSLPDGEPALPVCAPANQPPAPSGGPFTIPENSPNGTVVGTVAANDPDAGQSHTFSIISGDPDGAFAIDSGGQITVVDSTALDFETKPSLTLTIQATDNGTPNLSGTGTVIVNLTDANEPPLPSGGPFSIPENSPNGTSVGTVLANDPDAGQTHTFTILSGNVGGAFAIDSATGQITVANSAALDFESMPSFSLTVEVTDSGSLTGSTTVVVNLSNVPEAPVATDEGTPAAPYVETVGNTLLEVTAAPSPTGASRVVFNGNVLTNDFDPDGPTTFTLALESATAGALVTLNPDGTFTYVPPPGFIGVDSFTYRITGPDSQFDTATVYINVEHRVWYVRNDAAADGLGRSTDPLDTLAEAESASSAGDTIYLFAGNDTTLGQSDGIALKSGQRLIGEALQLAVPAAVNINGVNGLTLRSTTGNKPKIENDDTPDAPGEDNGVSVAAISGNVSDVEIRGLEISGFNNAIDVTATGTNSASVTIQENFITGANFEGIDVNALSTGTVTLAIHGNSLTTTGTAIDVQRTSGTVYITAFGNNAVSGNTAGTGINVSGAIFDAVPGSAFDPVSGGVTVIGASGNGVGQSGLVLTNVQGRLAFADLDVFAENGAGLRASSPTAYTGSAGLQLVVSNPGVATLEAIGGPAVDISQASINLPFSSIKSAGSPTTGLALNSVTGSFSAEPTSSISNITSPAGTAFQVGSSNATITYKGTVSTTQGKGVDLTGNTGSTIDFSGTLTLSTGTNPAFTATGGGTVTATDTSNTLATTAGTALSVASTTLGSSGLTFRSISAGNSGAPANGIFLDSTGTVGALTVTGTGSSTALGGDGSGGVIQNATGATGSTSGIGVYVRNARATLRRMHIRDSDNYGIFGTGTMTFNLEYSTVDSTKTATSVNGDSASADDEEGSVAFEEWAGSGSIVSSIIGDGFSNNLRILNTNGSDLDRLTVSNSTFNNNGLAGNNNIHVESRNSGTTVSFTLQGSTIKGARADWLNASNNSSSAMDLVISGNAFSNLASNAHAAAAAGGNRLVLGSVGTMTYDILNNTLSGSKGEAIRVRSTAASGVAGSANGTISGNDIGLPGTANSGSSESSGIFLFTDGGGDQTALVTNNKVYQYNNHGIRVDVGDEQVGNSVVNVTVTNNVVEFPGNLLSDFNGIHVNHGTVAATDDFTSCIDVRLNDVTGSGNGGVYPNNAEIRLRQRQSTTIVLPGYTGLNNEDCSVIAFIAGQNTVNNSGAGSCTNGSPNPPTKNVAATTQNATTTLRGFESGAACVQPD